MEITPQQVAQVVLMGHELSRAEPELRGFIEAMPQDERAELVALFWIERGSFEADDWDEAVQTALAEATTPTADYLLGSPHFADHLQAGAEAMDIDITEVEEGLL